MSERIAWTPGPWRTGREDWQSYDCATGKPFSSVYADDERMSMHLGERLPLVIARINGEHLEREEEKANAKLIAAAPDIVAALQAARKWMDDRREVAEIVDAINMADAALAKAGVT